VAPGLVPEAQRQPLPDARPGPVAQCMNVNRGDAFDYLVSVSSPARGLHEYAVATFGADSPQAKERYALGDVNTSLIKTKLGRTIILIHDTNLPRPYTRINLVQGTRAWPTSGPTGSTSRARPAGRTRGTTSRSSRPSTSTRSGRPSPRRGGRGHGGMDYIEDYRLVQSLLKGEPLDQDVYDAAAWSAVVGASVRSVADRGRPVAIPDFTRGKWKTNPPLEIIEA